LIKTIKEIENGAGDKPAPVLEEKKANIKPKIDEFIFAPAQMGASNVAFTYKGKDYRLSLVDKKYVIGEEIQGSEREVLIKALLFAGFEHSYSENSYDTVKVEKKRMWVLGHPDNTERTKVNCNYSITYNDKNGEEVQTQVEVVEGAVKTTVFEIVEELQRQGFYNVVEKEL
jgi:hypothetical protein